MEASVDRVAQYTTPTNHRRDNRANNEHPMKRFFCHALSIGVAALIAAPAGAAITGQWDFNTDLSATIGQPISYLDAETEAADAFGTTTSFGIADIASQPAAVLKFPQTLPFAGYAVPVGAAGNGGGSLVNQYTIIMDVLFPAASS